MKKSNKDKMKILIGNIILLILSSTIISCNGQVKEYKKSAEIEKTPKITKIPVPKYGFSNGFVDKDGTIWFSSNGGGVFHYDGKTFKKLYRKKTD